MSCDHPVVLQIFLGEPDKETQKMMKEWLSGRPESIREMARKLPPGTRFLFDDGFMRRVISYFEDGGVGLSSLGESYDLAVVNREVICGECLSVILGEQE